jgi:hypothetical protein
MSRLLTLEEAAERLRVSKHTLYNWLQRGENGIRRICLQDGEEEVGLQGRGAGGVHREPAGEEQPRLVNRIGPSTPLGQ